jgi:hypothetical protein
LSNTSWSITENADWLDLSQSTGSNDGAILVTANTTNTGTSPRTATVTISGVGVTNKTVVITQDVETIITTGSEGITEVYSSTSTTANRRAVPVVFSEDGTIQSISIYHNGGTDNVLLGVYSDQSGSPFTKLGATLQTAVSAGEGWQTVTLENPVNVISGQKVWLAWVFQTNPGIRYEVGTPARAQSVALWPGGMPESFGTSSFGNYKYSIYCNYTTGFIPELNVSTSNVSLDYGTGSSGAFDITSNTSWSVTDNADWLDLSQATGSNDETILVTANSTNTGTSPRTATVTVSGDGVTNKTVIITQDVEIATTTETAGITDVYESTSTTANRRAVPVVISEDGTIQSISMYHNGGTGNVLLGVYSDQSGSPSAKLGATIPTVVSAGEGWQTVTLENPVNVISGQKVWLAWVFQTNPGIRYEVGTPARAQSPSLWPGGMPESFGTSSFGNYKYSIYCTYTTSGTKAADIATDVDIVQKLEVAELNVYPNPFSEKLKFEFVSPESVNARIDLYDMTGRLVKTIFEQPVEGGASYEAEFRPESIVSGMFIYRVILGEAVHNGKVVFKKK